MSSNSTIIENNVAASTSAKPAADCGSQCMNLPGPGKEHEWLQRFVGEWESDVEVSMAPDQPAMKTRGAERVRSVGGFWVVSEGKNLEFPFEFVLTLGYDKEKAKYVGTWLDTMSSYLWKYEGEVDSTGQILTMLTEGPSPMAAGKHHKFRETTQFKSADHRVFTSSMLGDDGKWTTFLTVNSHRKK